MINSPHSFFSVKGRFVPLTLTITMGEFHLFPTK
jgi:hypothetical protein